MRTSDFDFDLPERLIAQVPVEPRDAARLLVLDRKREAIRHRVFRELGEELSAGDLLVLNDTRVLRARLRGRTPTGADAEILLLRNLGEDKWEALVRPGKRLRPGRRVLLGPNHDVEATIEATADGGERIIRFPPGCDPEALGETPLPPYIHESIADAERYQTVYARSPGSAAAPTAGLHMTPELLTSLQEQGIRTETITLHIGPGTFRPVQVENPADHPMHAEFYQMSGSTAQAIRETRAAGRRIVAVGTTVVRTLEQAAEPGIDRMEAAAGWTRLLILPGYRFRAVDTLITNFHLPRSTLLMLVSALAGREFTLRAYREAVELGYRFYSFGDAMVIV